MRTTLIAGTLLVCGLLAYANHDAESAGPVPATAPGRALAAPTNPLQPLQVTDRYLVPDLPQDIVDRLPVVEATGDQYLTQRIALADLVVGERILAAQDLATIYARDLPGFDLVLQSGGFRQDTKGYWFYDPFASWMRFPLHR